MLTKTAQIPFPGTEQRLLEAAGEIFAEHGYRAATVRQICEKAKANVAAINYHFRDKDGLYLAVLRHLNKVHAEKNPTNSALGSKATAEQKLRAFISAMLHRMLDEDSPDWHMKLMAREMIEPTHALDAMVEESVRPLQQELEIIVREFLGADAQDEVVRLSTLSVASQCVFYHHCRSIISRLFPQQKYGSQKIDTLVEHVTRFSLAALKNSAKERKRKSR
jgi:TetR/AcrR family transcriptional regulator, regulator of cefoperazone and chloramphenicol sensitivity